MCGFAGSYRYIGIASEDVDIVKKMSQTLRHRGPDDQGHYSDECCALEHRRLAIIDLSREGRQPFVSDDGRYHLIYNGEIYNYVELREKLKQLGWKFRTLTDTEVLLKAYQEYGHTCLSQFNGMFAFAIYDSQKQQLFIARDRMGIKPFYYYIDKSTFYFASEIKAFLTIPSLNKSINYQSIFDYFVFNRTDIYDETFFSEIKRLPKGCWAAFDESGLNIHRWWAPEDYLELRLEEKPEDVLNTIRGLFISSAQLRMRSDVTVGSCLSGGLDSSILLGVLFHHYGLQNDFSSFTASFPGRPIDEVRYVEALTRKYPFKNFRALPTAESAYNNLRDFVYTNDEPTTNPSFYSQYEVMRLAKKNNVTVLIDGQGGDENFAGYQYFHGFYWNGLLRNKKLLLLTSELTKSLFKKQHRAAYQTLLFQILPDAQKKQLLRRTVPFLNMDFFQGFVNQSTIFNEFFNTYSLNSSIVRHFQYKLEHLLRMEDRNSMAFSLEARVPYLDHRLVEYTLAISENMKIKHGETKYLQKKALGHYTVPEILKRTDKIGFGTPGGEWMSTELWKNFTYKCYSELTSIFPEIFNRHANIPEYSLDRWKINQLATWWNVVYNA